MKLFFANSSIKTKIISMIVAVSAVVLLIAAILFFVYDRQEFRKKMLRDLSVLAQTIGDNNTANLSFPINGKSEAEASLRTLEAEKNVAHAILFDKNKKKFAEYIPPEQNALPVERLTLPNDTFFFEQDHLVITKPIHYNDKLDGVIYIKTSLNEYDQRVTAFLLVLLIIFSIALFLALLLAMRVQRHITKPVFAMHNAMREVSKTKDYSIRTPKMYDDEIGKLSERFNEMLHQIGKREKDLKLAKDQAEYSLKVKEQFLANMSHEIRTPMNAIIGMADLLCDTELSQDQSTYLDNIKISADNLLVIVNDILDLSKIEAGKVQLEKIEFNLHQALTRFKNTFEYSTRRKGLDFHLDIDAQVPAVVVGDQVRLNQVIMNLAGNAVKFTESGWISINVKLRSQSHEEVCIEFAVSDTGIGIPKQKQQRIFKSFSQARSDTTRKYGGTGLGLSISKQLVELQGGEIWLESQEGVGSTFSFYVCFGKAKPKATQTSQHAKETTNNDLNFNKNTRLLVAEDNKINQLFAATLLKKNNFQTDIAENGKQAVEKHRQNPYDLILMDLHMPEMDGYQACQLIRQSETSDKHVPIVALTAAATKSEIDKCFAIGMDDYVLKPFKPSELIHKVLKLTMEQKQNTPRRRHTDMSYLKNMAGGSNETIKEMIDIFLEQVPEFVDAINDSLKQKKWAELKKIAHKAKSSVAIVGMAQTEKDLKTLELLAADEKEDQIPEYVAKFVKDVNEASKELEDIYENL